MRTDKGDTQGDRGSRLDKLNDLILENGQLKRKLVQASISTTTQDDQAYCHACKQMELTLERRKQATDKLRADSEHVISVLQQRTQSLVNELANEQERVARMDAIILRQRALIERLTQSVRSGSDTSGRPVDVSPEPVLRMGRGEFGDIYPGYSFPNEFPHPFGQGQNLSNSMQDMDDVMRQLHELDDNLQRVESSTSRLSSSTREAFSIPSNSRPSKQNTERNNNTVLNRILPDIA